MDYRDAGVDITAADAAKARIKGLAKATFNAGVLTEIGSFGGMFRPDLSRFEEPVLVASTDGVGTKIRVATLAGVHDTVGYDLVAHCVDDILVQGAVPLFFLDYVALGRMDPQRVADIVTGFARACEEFGCPLIGGETAEMPGTYAPDDYDLAGFIVGVVDRKKALPRRRAGGRCPHRPSLDRIAHQRVLARSKGALRDPRPQVDSLVPELGTTVGQALLACHKGYLDPVLPLLERDLVRGMAHITGGGFPGNIPEFFPQASERGSDVDPGRFCPSSASSRRGDGSTKTRCTEPSTWALGMILVVSPEHRPEVERSLERRGEPFFVVGSVVAGSGVSLED